MPPCLVSVQIGAFPRLLEEAMAVFPWQPKCAGGKPKTSELRLMDIRRRLSPESGYCDHNFAKLLIGFHVLMSGYHVIEGENFGDGG